MKLSYRGISYNSEPSFLITSEGEIGGKYRGSDWRYRYPSHIPQQQPNLERKYRGVPYGSRPIANTEVQSVSDSCPIPMGIAYKITVSEATQTHLENIRRHLERRLQVAEAGGNEELVRLLKAEEQQLALNG